MLRTRPLRVLVVDDNHDVADSAALLLELLGCEVRTAYQADEAVKAADGFQPEVLLIDVMLPGTTGYEVGREVCRLARRRPVLVAVTGHPHLEDRSREEGFDHHLLKPVDPEDLAYLLASYTPEDGPPTGRVMGQDHPAEAGPSPGSTTGTRRRPS
jgi:CheY-like chemotaxis protein